MFRTKLAPQSFRLMFLHRHQPGEDQAEELRLISPGNHAHTSISIRVWAVAPTRCKVSAEMLAEQPDRPDVARGESIGRCRVVGLRHQARPRAQPVGGFVRGNAGVLLRKDRILARVTRFLESRTLGQVCLLLHKARLTPIA